MKDRFHADIYRCPTCRWVKLYAAESGMVTCPVCGISHPANERCVLCALNLAFKERRDRRRDGANSPLRNSRGCGKIPCRLS